MAIREENIPNIRQQQGGKKNMMTQTKNDLAEATRTKVCGVLSQSLADAIDLVYQAKQAHWNIKGLQFRSLHKLFDAVAETAEEYADEFAERIVQLGGVAQGTVRVSAQKSSLPEYPLELILATQHVDTLGDRVALFGKNIRGCIDTCEGAGDIATADIYTDAVKDIDKLTWMIDSYLFELRQEQKTASKQVA